MTVSHFNQLTNIQSVGVDVCKASAKIGVIEGEKFKTFGRSEEEILLKKKIALIANLETTLQSMKAGVRAYHEGLKKL
ncbi:MAG: hypothetical protein LBG52_02175 [Candidatus Peribacteria bacterium]|jgi:hypothetical protein|nr:hypothetical protein [Candidatus Peribacteria bacterium]